MVMRILRNSHYVIDVTRIRYNEKGVFHITHDACMLSRCVQFVVNQADGRTIGENWTTLLVVQ
jgi:hypothetical protein